ncbi:unnamed protein product [Notodromas monacha]|uniref:Major facilitator superfamily domain containing 12 n=1 Tax=Notodromas monacha TaxID=399045 RepID=A0A7R9GAU0_9CRUS|nr:unnamed protein product [Notodromas monacha]CAG0915809.1 unnamed protein product [Notodromas monacha]
MSTLVSWPKWAFAVGHVLNDLCASLWFTYLLVYFHFVLKFDNKLSGIILMIGQIADAISTPFVGLESDRDDGFYLCKYGRRKTWHLIGTLCVLGTMPFIFMKCINCENSSQSAQLLYYGAFVAIFQFGWASVQISHLSLIPELASCQHERTGLNALRRSLNIRRYAFTVASNVTVYVIAWASFGIEANDSMSNGLIGPQNSGAFTKIVLISLSIGAVFSIIFHVGVKEPPSLSQMDRAEREQSIKNRGFMKPGHWMQLSEFYKTAMLYMVTRLYVNITQVYIPLYLQDSLNLEARNLAIVPLVMYVSGFGSSFCIKWTNRRLGRKVSYLAGSAVGLVACGWIYLGEGEIYKHYWIYAVAVLAGMCSSTILITSLSITSDLIGENTESGAFVYGAMSFADKLSNGLVIVLIQSLHPCSDPFVLCDLYYRQVLGFACGVFLILASLAVLLIQSQSDQAGQVLPVPTRDYGAAEISAGPAVAVRSTNTQSSSFEDDSQ